VLFRSIFPRSIDDTLNETVYLAFREKAIEHKETHIAYDVIDEPIELNTDFYNKKSIAHAIIKKKNGILKTLKYGSSSLTQTRKVRFAA
jgi:hypothetical protein